MIDIVAFRGLGDKDGGEIFDPLLSALAPALQRGKYEIDFNTPKIPTSMEIEYTPSMRHGDQVTAIDSRTNEVVHGVVKDFSHVIEGPVVFTKVSVEVPQ